MGRKPMMECSPEKLLLLQQLMQERRQLESQLLLEGLGDRPWFTLARPKQLPPHDPRHCLPDANGFKCGCDGVDSKYEVFLLCAGRGLGKTLSGANNIVTDALSGCVVRPGESCHQCPHTFGVVAPTRDHLKQTCFEGDSGILSALEAGELIQYNKSLLMITLRNGNLIRGFSAENEERYRGPNLSGVWVDELGVFKYEGVWHQMRLALRIGRNPHIYVTTTPRPTKLIRQLFKDSTTGKVHITTGSTRENEANLSASMLESLYGRYGGTRMGRQELEGSLLEDIPGALWHRDWFDRDRVTKAPATLTRVVVAMDPAVTTGEDSDETGIIVAGQDENGHAYVLADFTRTETPYNCCKRAIDAYHEFKADAIVGEQNNGGDYIRDLVHSINPDIPYRQVYATRGKATRAQPVSSLYEQGRVHHVGSLPELEDQMSTWLPDDLDSPDRMDACLAAGTAVRTQRGEIPIEDVRHGDLTWTRAGWKHVLGARLTKENADVVTVQLSTGRQLSGTPDHKVLTARGWLRMDALVWGDIMSGWSLPPLRSSTKASLTSATPKASTEHTVSTTKHHATADAAPCTETSGWTVTPVRSFPVAATSTTSTMTRSTTIQPTCSCSHQLRTHRRTRKSSTTSAAPGLPRSDHWLPDGIPVLQDSPGIGNTGNAPGKPDSGSLAAAPAATKSTQRRFLSTHDTAPEVAESLLTTGRTVISRKPVASSAERSSGGASTAPLLSPVPVHVVASCAGRKSDVYDLMVADVHEFLAEGLIVHNCVWAVHWLRDMFTGGWAAAYGTVRCEICEQMIVRRDRTLCPKCGAILPGEAA